MTYVRDTQFGSRISRKPTLACGGTDKADRATADRALTSIWAYLRFLAQSHSGWGMMLAMRYVLLTWNPGPYDEDQYTPEQWLDGIVIPLQSGEQPEGDRWSIGTNWKSIAVGDAVCMLRQGSHGRGIVALGSITEAPYVDAHWNTEKGGEGHHVHVQWDPAIDINQIIT